MLCQFPDEYQGRLDAAVSVQCVRCGESATASVFPIRRRCSVPEPEPALPKASESVCVHRGAEARRVKCGPCGDRVTLKVFTCEVYGECTVGSRVADVAGCCQGCPSQALRVAGGTGAPCDVAVIVICHNYGRFLKEAIHSVLAQTRPPAEIVVIDDASTDETPAVAAQFGPRGVRYQRVDVRDVHRARAAGLAATRASLVCFLDADDILPPDYLEAGIPLFDNPPIGIVYSDVELFGNQSGRIEYPADPGNRIHQENFVHAGSLVRRTALEMSRVFEIDCPPRANDDWFLWRRIVPFGWRLAKSSAVYRYRKHPASKLAQMNAAEVPYFERAALALEQVTLAIPLSGRVEFWPRMANFLERQTWPHDLTRLLLIDTSQSSEFGRSVRRWLSECDYPQVQYNSMAVADPGLADEDRRGPGVRARVQRAMPRIYNRVRAETTTEYLWIVEDDVLSPVDVCERLLRSFDATTVSVSGVYQSRFHPGYVAWDQNGRLLTEPGEGVAVIGGQGFGCVILRKSVLDEYVIHHGGRGDYDPTFYAELQGTRWRAKVDWGCEVGHG